MSQLNVGTIKDQSGSGQPDLVGVAKAFVNFNGIGTVAVRSAFNIESVVDTGVGQFTLNFSNALTSESPAVNITAWSTGISAQISGYYNATSTSVNITVTTPNGGASADPKDISVTIHSI